MQVPHVDIPECTCADGIIARASDPSLYAQGSAPAYKPTTCPVHGHFTAKPDRIRQPFVSEWAAEAAAARIDAHVTASVADATRMVSNTTMSRLEIHALIEKYTEVLCMLCARCCASICGRFALVLISVAVACLHHASAACEYDGVCFITSRICTGYDNSIPVSRSWHGLSSTGNDTNHKTRPPSPSPALVNRCCTLIARITD